MKTNSDIILGMHQPLLGNISSNFRMICADWDDTFFKIYVYVYKEPTTADTDLVSTILTDFENNIKFDRYEEMIEFSSLPLHQLNAYKVALYIREE